MSLLWDQRQTWGFLCVWHLSYLKISAAYQFHLKKHNHILVYYVRVVSQALQCTVYVIFRIKAFSHNFFNWYTLGWGGHLGKSILPESKTGSSAPYQILLCWMRTPYLWVSIHLTQFLVLLPQLFTSCFKKFVAYLFNSYHFDLSCYSCSSYGHISSVCS